jgi:hypothetical protein
VRLQVRCVRCDSESGSYRLLMKGVIVPCEMAGAEQAGHDASIQAAAAELELQKARADSAEEKVRRLASANEELSSAIKISEEKNADRCRELSQKIAEAAGEAAAQEKRASRAIQDLTKAEAHHLELSDKITAEEAEVARANERYRAVRLCVIVRGWGGWCGGKGHTLVLDQHGTVSGKSAITS